MTDTMVQTGTWGLWIFQFHQDTWNRYLMLEDVSPHIAWNAISNLELRRSSIALLIERVLPSASTLSIICPREDPLTMDAITKQLPSQNEVSFSLDGWKPTNKLAIMSVIAYYMNRDWALHEVQLAFDEVACLFLSRFPSQLRMIGEGSTN